MNDDAFLTGHKIYLRTPTDEDVIRANWHRWYNDASVTRYNSHGIFPVTIEHELNHIHQQFQNADTLMMGVFDQETDKVLGNVSLYNIDLIHRRSSISLTIGETAGLSVGIEAFGLMIDHGFCRLNLNRIADGTHEKLATFVKMLEIIGFQVEGCGRQQFLRDGNYYDSIQFGVIAEDFFKLREARAGSILFDSEEKLNSAIVAASRS